MKKIKILQYGALTPTYGGIESYIYSQWKNLDKSQIQYDFLVDKYAGEVAYEKELTQGGGIIYRNWIGRGRSIFKHYRELYKFFQTHHYDGVVCNLLELQNIDCILMACFFRIPLRVVHSHQAYYGGDHGLAFNFLEKIHRIIVGKVCTHLFACSDDAGRWMFGYNWKKNKKSFIIKNGVDVEQFVFSKNTREQLRKKFHLENKIVFGHTGRLSPPKNQIFSIEIFHYIHEKIPNAIFFFIGEGILRSEMEQKIEEYGLEDAVILLGERHNISDFLQVFDYFIFPSEWEGLGISLIEAQISGLRCFVSDKIPSEAIVTNEVKVISLQKNAKIWSDYILANLSYNRIDQSDLIRKNGYDAKRTAKIVQDIYVKSIQR